MNLCVTKLLPHSNMNTFLWLKVEVVGVVQALIERLLKIDKIWHPHWGRGKKKIRKINARRWGDTRNVKGQDVGSSFSQSFNIFTILLSCLD